MPLLSTFGAASTRSFGGIGAATAGEVLDIDDVFSIDLWTSDGSSTQTITNNIDLSTEGGLVWIKDRSTARNHVLFDTERVSGATDNYLFANSTAAQVAHQNEFGDFTTTGYTLPRNTEAGYTNTNTGRNYVGWTWRKAPRFFDVQTWTGNGTARSISHNLGSVPAMVIYKNVTSAFGWQVYHSGMAVDRRLELAATDSASSSVGYWDQTTPVTSTVLNIGTDDHVNKNGDTFVAYIFANNNSDGEFGPDSDQDVIKCGSYTGNGSATGPIINLGFEPQFVMVKNALATGGWQVMDTMRGMPVGNDDARLQWNVADAETDPNFVDPQPTGFQVTSTGSNMNTNGATYIYMAIRRGPLAEPENATDVFSVNELNNPRGFVTTGFPVDLHMQRKTESGDGFNLADRLRGKNKFLYTTETSAEYTFGSTHPAEFDHNNGIDNYSYSSQSNKDTIFYNWRRAPSYFDMVAYSGNSTERNITHNLGVTPEMIWVKQRTGTKEWFVHHKDLPSGRILQLESTMAHGGGDFGTISSTTFGTNAGQNLNASNHNYIAYLFATLDGISKVGSFSHTSGSDTNVDCSFSSGARLVIVKRYDATGHWVVWDTARGIVAGNDPRLFINSTAGENTSTDAIDPYNQGFTITGNWLATGDYIFYANA